jgi:oxygen-dependent protoporphyrinogen oxidase
VFTTLRSGLGTLIERMAVAIPAKSAQLSDEVIALTRKGEGWRIRTVDAEDICDAVVLATPAHITRRLLRRIDEGFDQLLAIDATSAVVVALAFSAGIAVPPGFGYLVPPQPDVDPQLLACTFVHQKFPHRVPEGGALLRAFFGGDTAAALLNESDAALTELAMQRLAEVLGSLPPPEFSIVRRWPWSLPQYAVGHLKRMAELENLVTSHPGLYLAGNAYYGVGLPDMVRMGRAAAIRAQSRLS